MKLILTIISDMDNESVSRALVQAGFHLTRIASTGGFFRRGNTTLLIGTEDEKVEEAIQLIRSTVSPLNERGGQKTALFVLNVDGYTQI
jgi:uncharacterized protein YaaQ